jgi:pimeloyl-ACP methyl ester carboxylesterase
MLACELAANFPAVCGKLVLLGPVGLWLDEHPVTNFAAAAPQDIPALLFHDTGCDAAVAMFTPPDDADAAIAAIVAPVWATGCTTKYLWPIPDKGLAKRIHRVTAPTLIVWGEQDALISSVYAAEFGRLIAGSRVEVIANCGHIPQMEQLEQTVQLVREFLG